METHGEHPLTVETPQMPDCPHCRRLRRLEGSVRWARETLWRAYRGEWDHRRRATLRAIVEALSEDCPKVRGAGGSEDSGEETSEESA